MSTFSNTAGSMRVVVCRFGHPPEVAMLEPDAEGSYLEAMQAIVGGRVERIRLDEGLELWANEDRAGLPLHMVIPGRAPEVPEGFEVIALDDGLAAPGELGEWHIYGDCLLSREVDGRIADVTDEDVERWLTRWFEAALLLLVPIPNPAPSEA